MRLSGLRVEVLSDATAAGLTTTVNDWIKANAGERVLVSLHFSTDGATFCALIAYVE